MNAVAKPQPLQPDLAMAERYLTLLDEAADSFVFQTFDDLKERKNPGLAAKRIGSFRQHSQTLTRANLAGAGVFVTVNETDGQGRKLENITRIRTIWHEEDTPHSKPFPMEPHFSIESSPGKFHHYWLVDDLSKDEFAGVMECMIQVYGSDPNVKDIARVLRIPGFYHQKNPSKPFMVRIIHESGGLPYAREHILAAFPPMEKLVKPVNVAPMSAPDGEVTDGHRAIAASLAAKAAAATHADPTKGRHSQVLWLGRECAHKGIPQEVGGYALQCFAKLMRPTDTTGNIAPLNFEAELKTFNDAYAKGLAIPPTPWQAPLRRDYDPPMPPPPDNMEPDWLPVDALPVDHDPPKGVISIEAENKARMDWESQIASTDDFSQLVYEYYPQIERSKLREPTKAMLTKKLAKKAGLTLSELKGSKRFDEPPPMERHRGDWLEDMNQRHAVVTQAGKTRIMNIEHDPVWNRTVVTFSAVRDFQLRYGNKFTHVGTNRMNLADAWIEHPERKEYRSIAFMPGHELGESVYNLWQGFGVQAEMKGSCKLFLDYFMEVICMGCQETHDYVWNWMAHLFQYPSKLPGTALVLRSIEEGTGKSFFVSVLKELVGQEHSVELTNMQHLTGQFSAHRAGALLVFANEATWGGDKAAAGILKAMITDADSLMEEKHANAVKIKNFSRLIVASNNPWPIARGEKDRRIITLDVSAAHVNDAPYFAAIAQELKAGGYETLMHLLMNSDISNWNPQTVPLKVRMRGWDLKLRDDPILEWYFELLDSGINYRDPQSYVPSWSINVNCSALRNEYYAWCRKRMKHSATIQEIGRSLKRWGVIRGVPGNGEKNNYIFKELGKARRNFMEAIDGPQDYWESVDCV